MGRKRKNSNNKQRNGKRQGKRRGRQTEFWVESVAATPNPTQAHDFHVIITRASLTDDHHGHGSEDIANGKRNDSDTCQAETNVDVEKTDNKTETAAVDQNNVCLLYTSPSPRD